MLTRSAIAGPPPPNDSCASATLITAVPYIETAVTSGATTEASDPAPECGNESPAKSVWYRFTAPQDGTITADTLDSGYDTILSSYTGSCDALAPLPDGCNDDDPQDGAQSRVRFPAAAGTTYYFMVSAFEDDGGDLMWRLRFFIVPSTPTPTETSTPTPTATPVRPGDANCDGRRTAADVPALIRLIATGDRAECLLDDANGDGDLNVDDVFPLIEALFAS